MFKLLPLILENEVDQESDLGQTHVLSEKGFGYLKSKIDEMNKKAAKWNVPPMELKVLKEEFVKKKIPVNFQTQMPTTWDDPGRETKEVTVKQYSIQVIGEPPRVEGYEFIAKVEHTPDGNILNYAPKASDKSLPSEYRTARQACDVCKTNRERNNTFILKLDKDDPERFPEKRKGDFVMVGSSCLKRFLPNISANALMEYAEMIEALRDSIHSSGEMDDDFSGGFGRSGQGNWLDQSNVGLWLSATYLHTGKYLSKKKAEEFSTSSTLDRAFSAMNSRVGIERGRDIEDEIHKRMRTEEEFKQKAETFNKEFTEWAKTKDFDTLIQQKPEFADFFHNLKVIAKQETFKSNNAGFFSALFQLFLRDRGDLERKAAQKKAAENFTYFGQEGGKIKVKAKVTKIKEYESQWGQGIIVFMEAEGSEVDPATGQPVSKKGNLIYFTKNFELGEGEEGEIEATVKKHEINKYTQIPETAVTRVKVVKNLSNPAADVGKAKMKDLKGVVKIGQLQERQEWSTGQKTYYMNFSFDARHHPDMTQVGTDWGIGFYWQIPDEATYQTMKQYENKMVEAKWSLSRATTLDKLKMGSGNTVSKFSIIQVLGDVPPRT